MTRRSFADKLEAAAADIGRLSTSDLQALLRRAALQLRNAGTVALDEPAESAFTEVIAGMGLSRSEALQAIVIDWLVSHGRLPNEGIDEESA